MEKRSRNKSPQGEPAHLLHRVMLEQQAATEELRASNSELDRLLEEVLSARNDLRGIAAEEPGAEPETPETSDRPVGKPEVILEQARAAIRDSMRLRRRSQCIREAMRTAPGAKAATPQSHQSLSKREHQVLTLIVDGKSSKEIAAELGISFKTAVTHRASIMSKLDVHEIASVVREAIRRGLV
jgi:DNA-binding CsgD family transcriptional regulator